MDKKEFIIWFAGFFDGEGSIRVQRLSGENMRMKSPFFRLTIRVSNTNQEAIKLITTCLGGSMWETYSPPNKRSYNWQVSSANAGNILEIIEPYLIIKKAQALLAIKFQEGVNLNRGKYGGGPSRCLPQELIEKRNQLRVEISKLNKVGPRARTVIRSKSSRGRYDSQL